MKNKFYCVVIEDMNVDDLFYFEKEYNQKVYEFDTKIELDNFVNVDDEKKEAKNITKVLPRKQPKNTIYLIKNNGRKKVLEHKFILDPKDFSKESTTIVIWPSMDTYILNCHEDYVYEGACTFSEISKKEINVENILSEIKLTLLKPNIFKYHYVGKSLNFDFEDESRILISNYLGVNIIFKKEDLDYLKRLRDLDLLSAEAMDNIENAKNFLILLRIIDEKGNILAPYDKIIYKDALLDNSKENGKPKIKSEKRNISNND